jgi:hypothetical protein
LITQITEKEIGFEDRFAFGGFIADGLDDLLVDFKDRGILMCLNTGALGNFPFPTIFTDGYE